MHATPPDSTPGMQHVPGGPSHGWHARLLRLLEEQASLVASLAERAEKQTELIGAARTDELLALLGSRQEIIERFSSLQEEIAPLLEGIDERLAPLEESDRARIADLVTTIGDGLAAVLRGDESDRRALSEARDRARSGLSGLATARTARRAYLGGSSVNNRFEDRKG